MNYNDWPRRPKSYNIELIQIVDRYLLGSLAIGVSQMSRSFIEALDVTLSVEAETIVKQLAGESLDMVFFDSAAELKEKFESLQIENSPWEHEEYFYCIRTNKAEARTKVESLKEYEKANRQGLKEEATSQIKRRFYELDSIFRHLRNALAHGCFRYIDASDSIFGKSMFFFFDLNSEKVTSIGVLSVERLSLWYTSLCRIAGDKV